MKSRKRFTLDRRPALLFGLVCAAFAGLMLRLLALQSGENAAISATADTRTVHAAESRGMIYDRSLRPIVNADRQQKIAALCVPENAALIRSGAGLELGEGAVRGACVLFEANGLRPQTGSAALLEILQRYAQPQPCTHMVGYVNAEGLGVCGIERAFDKVLSDAAGSLDLICTVNGYGAAIPGAGLRVEDAGYGNATGVCLTVDLTVQRAAERAMREAGFTRAAVVALDVTDGAILASASLPAYDPGDPAASLEDPDLPFLNRVLEAYPVGSVVKPFVAVSAIENGVAVNGNFVCTGCTAAGDVSFYCFGHKAHGSEDLEAAMCNSCNTYFIDLGARLGGEALLGTLGGFGFGESIELAGPIVSVAGALPREEDLLAPAALANLCFGQGAFTASPLQLAAAYAALANGGVYNAPYLLRYLIDETGAPYAYYANGVSRRAADAGVCAVVSRALHRNMQIGTGVNARPENAEAAGKTATAQTGRYDETGAEQLCTWFCGYVPYEAPRYAVAVLDENGSSASERCAAVFRAVAEALMRL